MIKQSELFNNKISYSNRGMNLENDINLSCNYYINNDIAYIYKKPTPIKLIKVDYKNKKINEAYFMTPSTTDYNGIYKGKYIDFEAKETISKTSFSLNNIHDHQIKHLINVKRHGGICFLIVRFTTIKKDFLLDTKYIEEFIKSEKRKSIPLSFFETYGKIIPVKYVPRLDFISVIKKEYFGGNLND